MSAEVAEVIPYQILTAELAMLRYYAKERGLATEGVLLEALLARRAAGMPLPATMPPAYELAQLDAYSRGLLATLRWWVEQRPPRPIAAIARDAIAAENRDDKPEMYGALAWLMRIGHEPDLVRRRQALLALAQMASGKIPTCVLDLLADESRPGRPGLN